MLGLKNTQTVWLYPHKCHDMPMNCACRLDWIGCVVCQGSMSTQPLETGRSVSTPSNSKTRCSAWCKCLWQFFSVKLQTRNFRIRKSFYESQSLFVSLTSGMWKDVYWLPSLTGHSPFSIDQRVFGILNFLSQQGSYAPTCQVVLGNKKSSPRSLALPPFRLHASDLSHC